jgi:hypothetical protein
MTAAVAKLADGGGGRNIKQKWRQLGTSVKVVFGSCVEETASDGGKVGECTHLNLESVLHRCNL